MSAKDIVHEIVREALEKDGWIITHDPFFLIASQLLEAGVSKENIMLGFRSPFN